MRRAAISALACSLAVAAAAACASDNIASAPDSAVLLPSSPTANANLNCHYSPDGEQSIAVGSSLTMLANSTTDCSGAYAVLSMSVPGSMGFTGPTGGCSGTTKTLGNLKVVRCASGPGKVDIYASSNRTTLIQTIGFDRL